MFYISRIGGYLKIFYIFLTTTNKAEKYVEVMESNSSNNCVHHCNNKILNLFDLELQLINTKQMIKN